MIGIRHLESENALAQHTRFEDEQERFTSLFFGIDTTRKEIELITDYS